MPTEAINSQNAATFFNSIGDLHDARINNIKINFGLDVKDDYVEFDIDDLYKSMRSTADIDTATPVTVRFFNVSEVYISVRLEEGIRIGTLKIVEENDVFFLKIYLNIGFNYEVDARHSITCSFQEMEIVDRN